MAGYLLDTNIISETRKPRPHGGVLAWIRAREEEEIFLPAVVFGEMEAGLESTRRSNPERTAVLEAWLDEVERFPRIIPMGAAVFRTWARLMRNKPPN
jgi:predicted nucleic acid-binding protein